MCRSRRELSNAYLLAKFGFDTAENEPCKVCLLSAYRSPRLQELPHYAVPTCYVLLDRMPIAGASVKVDRKALPKPPSPTRVAEMPKSSDTGEKWFDGSLDSCLLLFEIVLELPFDTLSADSNFFEFGGYSLTATKLMGLIKKHITEDYLLNNGEDNEVQVKLKIPSIAEFLQAPTPLQLSEFIVGGALYFF